MKTIRIITLASVCLLAALPAVARAQSAQAPRSGWWFSGGVGAGWLGCQNCTTREAAGSAALAVGGTLTPNLRLGVAANVWAKQYSDGVTYSIGTVTVLLKWYPSPGGFYLQGGLGGSADQMDYGDGTPAESYSGTGGVLGAGYDLPVSSKLSLTPFVNGVGIKFRDGDANFGQIGLAISVH